MNLWATIIVMAIAFGGGWTIQGWRLGAAEKDRIEAAAEVKRESRRVENRAAVGHEKDREALRTEFITITETVEKIVEKPVYRDVCFDDDGVRALNRAVSGAGAAGSEPSPAVPGPADHP